MIFYNYFNLEKNRNKLFFKKNQKYLVKFIFNKKKQIYLI